MKLHLTILFLSLIQLGFAYRVVNVPLTRSNDPPLPSEVAKMARYIMHNCDWVSIATKSTMQTIKGYPFVSLKSVSDGPVNNGTGIPYLYMTDMDVSGKDVKADNSCTILASLAESDYCKQQNFDPQDPRCAKLIITGKLQKLDNSTAEYEFGKNALYQRHPEMKWWPLDHEFYVANIKIEQIAVLDFFGGIKYVTLEDYLNAFKVQAFNGFNIDFQNVEIIDIQV